MAGNKRCFKAYLNKPPTENTTVYVETTAFDTGDVWAYEWVWSIRPSAGRGHDTKDSVATTHRSAVEI